MYYYLFNQFSVTENLGLFLVFCLVTMVMMNISKQLSGYFIQLICWTGADGLNHQLNTFQLKGVDFSLFSLGQKSSSLGECWILYTLPSTGSVLFLHVFLLLAIPLQHILCRILLPQHLSLVQLRGEANITVGLFPSLVLAQGGSPWTARGPLQLTPGGPSPPPTPPAQAQQETQKAALRYERAVSMHNAAREMVFVAEQGVMADKNRLDPTWQEMLNHATCKVSQAVAGPFRQF